MFDLLIRAIKHVEQLDLHPRFTAGVNKSDRHTLYTRTSVKWNIHKKKRAVMIFGKNNQCKCPLYLGTF